VQKKESENLLKDILRYVPVKVLPAFSGLITIYILTRIFSLEIFANYTFIMASILITSQFISGWANSSVIYFYPHSDYENENDEFKKNIILIQLGLLFIGSLVLFLIVYFTLSDLWLSMISVILMLFQTLVNLFYSFLQTERRIREQIISTLIQSGFQIIGIVFCFYYFKNILSTILFAISLSYITSLFYLLKFCDFKKIFSIAILRPKSVNLKLAKDIFNFGLPICIWFFSTQFYSIGDRILFKFFNISFNVGNYSAFRDLAVGLSGFLTMPILLASHPIIMKLQKSGEEKKIIENLLKRNINIITTVFTGILFFICIFGDKILILVVGSNYLLDNILMGIIIATIYFAAIAMYIQKGLEVNGRTSIMSKLSLLVAFVSLLLNLSLIKKFGVNAACVVGLGSNFLYVILAYFYSKKYFKLSLNFSFYLKCLSLVGIAVYVNEYFENELFKYFICFILTSMLIFISTELKIIVKKIIISCRIYF